MSRFSGLLSDCRKACGLTLRDLAAKVGISASYLCDIEHDRRDPPSDAVIVRMATVLAADADWMFFAAGRLPPDIRERSVSRQALREAWERLRRTG